MVVEAIADYNNEKAEVNVNIVIPPSVLAIADTLHDQGDIEGAHHILDLWEQGQFSESAEQTTVVTSQDPNQRYLFLAS